MTDIYDDTYFANLANLADRNEARDTICDLAVSDDTPIKATKTCEAILAIQSVADPATVTQLVIDILKGRKLGRAPDADCKRAVGYLLAVLKRAHENAGRAINMLENQETKPKAEPEHKQKVTAE